MMASNEISPMHRRMMGVGDVSSDVSSDVAITASATYVCMYM